MNLDGANLLAYLRARVSDSGCVRACAGGVIAAAHLSFSRTLCLTQAVYELVLVAL